MGIIENTTANTWNRIIRSSQPALSGGLDLGVLVKDGRPTKQHFYIPQKKRAEHLVVMGITGTGKTRLLLSLCLQDILARRGFLYFDHHGDTIRLLLSAIAEEERRSGEDLSGSVVVIAPGDLDRSVGLNILESNDGRNVFVEIASITTILKNRWGLDHFGAPTEEVLRNSLFVLAANNLTLVELAPLLTVPAFRAQCLKQVANPDVREYFELRFEPLSDAMKAVRRDPVLNKLSEFVSDPHFKHILGQQQSTFSFADVLNQNRWVLVDLSKGRLGRHSSTLGSLIFGQIKAAIFRRTSRQIFSVYCDEIQNLLVSDADLDVLLAEARKFGISVVTANQFLDQFPPEMRSAVAAVSTHIYFQLSSDDAQKAAATLDGGKSMAEAIRNLPPRQFIAKSGHYSAQQVLAPTVEVPQSDFSSLLRRSSSLYATPRTEIDRTIKARRPKAMAQAKEVLDAWE